MVKYRISVIPGDGVGQEVIPAAWQVLTAAAEVHGGFELVPTYYDWGCAYYLKTGRMMPDDGLERLRDSDAIFLGAIGDPAVPDHVSLWGLLLPIRQSFDLYVNLRPVKLLRGVRSPLAGREPGSIDMVCVRENTEGEYCGVGGRGHRGFDFEVAVQADVFTRRGVERILRYAFELARRRRRKLASVTKSNAFQYSMPFWDEVTAAVGRDYPDVEVWRVLVDAAAYYFVLKPEAFDVVVGSNLFMDILTDLAAAITGGLGLAASANLDPEGRFPGLFEPVHGSAPDIAGRGIANPTGAIWAGALMLEHLGQPAAAGAVMAALEDVLAAGRVRTPDLGGQSTTFEFAAEVVRVLKAKG